MELLERASFLRMLGAYAGEARGGDIGNPRYQNVLNDPLREIFAA